MAEKYFVIKWDDELGQDWMNLDNLKSLIFGDTKIANDKAVIGEIHLDLKGITELSTSVGAALGYCYSAIGKIGLENPGSMDLIEAISILNESWHKMRGEHERE
jgi:hypothetical protein